MTIEELNSRIESGTVNEVVRVAEAKQIKALSKIADQICERPNVRLVLVTGASAAGKTTTAKRLCTQLMVNDCPDALHLSTDDYFVGDERNPRDENGELDYEHVDCVDIKLLAEDINALLSGKEIPRRYFDFKAHVPRYTDTRLSSPKGGMIVLEGIHALNPRLTAEIDEAMKFRVFIEPKPEIDVFGGIYPSSRMARLLRRLVRDNQFRKLSPIETFKLWPKVIAGEEKWIEPFRGNADVNFNSYLVYELAALKPYVGGLLERAHLELGDTKELGILRGLLELVKPISSEAIPGDSILRETIGGSQLEY